MQAGKNARNDVGKKEWVSVHGGHSGQFCSHAKDPLEAIVQRYIELGFTWVGLTEHLPVEDLSVVPQEELDSGLGPKDMQVRFADYFVEARRLQQKYQGDITLAVGFETEAFTGYERFVAELVDRHQPDYIVGSVHHVRDVPIDVSEALWGQVRDACGGTVGLYGEYLDLQHRLIERFVPEVVGHFDLIRMFDPDYSQTLKEPAVWQRVERNLELVRSQGGVLDFNVRALAKGQAEPYPCRAIRERAVELGIGLVTGDDSHGVASVGAFLGQGIEVLRESGVDMAWQLPVIRSYV